jgi:hypothetical protein
MPEVAVSVLLPVRDAVATLPAALESLLAQTLTDIEVLAVDDGSHDGSAELLAGYAARDARVRVLRGVRPGLVCALNHALGEARAALVARMDADDVADPDRLRLQARRLMADDATDILGCRVELFDDGAGGNAGMRRYVDWLNTSLDHAAIVADLYVESPLAHPSVMMRTSSMRQLGGYRHFDGPEDYDLWLRAARAGARFAKLPQFLLRWRDGPGRLTRRDPRYAAARFQALKVEALEAGPLARRPALALWGGGPVAKSWQRVLRARAHQIAAFVDVNPRRLGQRVAEVPVLTAEQAARLPDVLHLAAVGQPGARARVRTLAASLGLRDGRDLIAVA